MNQAHHSLLAETIDTYFPMSSNNVQLLGEHCTILELDKQRTFIRQSLANEQEYFLLDGLVRSYAFSATGDDITLYFYGAKSILPPNSTRTVNRLSTMYFETLMPSTLAAIPVGTFSDFMRSNAEINRFAHAVLERELQAKTRKEIGLAVLTSKGRLLELRDIFPALENRVSHAHIASYLGITQVSLSRLRKEIARNG